MRIATWVMAIGIAAASGLRADEEALSLNSRSELVNPAVDDLRLPTSLREDDGKDGGPRSDHAEFSIGPMGGFLKARDADHGTWFGGVQARLRFMRILAVEGSISFHQNEYFDGDVVVTQYPVQVSALLLPFPDGVFDPYVLAGVGWYFSRVDYDDSIGGGDDTDRSFGGHVGAGANFHVSPRLSLFGDFRWVFMDEPGVDNSNLQDEEFDFWHLTFGVSFGL